MKCSYFSRKEKKKRGRKGGWEKERRKEARREGRKEGRQAGRQNFQNEARSPPGYFVREIMSTNGMCGGTIW